MQSCEGTVEEAIALRRQRRRMAVSVARVTLGLSAIIAVVALVQSSPTLSLPRILALDAVMAAVSATLLAVTARASEARLLQALRAFVVVGVMVVVGGVLLSDGSTGVGVGFVAFVMLLSAFVLPPREHRSMIAFTAVLLLGLTAAGRAEIVWAAVPALGVGLLGDVGMRGYASVMLRLERERLLAARASAALRAVVDAAADATSGDVDEVFAAVTRAAGRLGNDATALSVLGADGRLRPAAIHGPVDALVTPSPSVGDGLAGEVVRTGRTVVVHDGRADEVGTGPRPDGRFTSSIGAPIVVGREIVGALVGGRYGGDRYDETAVLAFELLSSHAGRAIALARAVGEDRETLAQLRRLQQLQEDFVSTVSHELRTPLTVIDGAAETLVTLGDRLGPQTREALLTRISTNARSLAQVVTGILEMARLDRGLTEFQPERVDLAALVDRCITRLAPVLADHDLHVAVADDAVAVGDGTLLERVVDNLLVNAARHTPPGTTVRLRVEEDEKDADRVLVEVSDDGPGIAAHELGHITERFRRAGVPTRRSARGLGIGLALVDQVVRLHGARLTIESTVGEGTTFAFRLPAESTAAPRTLVSS